MSRHRQKWYGRPNKPPENWHTSDKPETRATVMRAINPHIDRPATQIAVSLSLDDWQSIWHAAKVISKARDTNWKQWFNWLSKTLTRQIKASDKRIQR